MVFIYQLFSLYSFVTRTALARVNPAHRAPVSPRMTVSADRALLMVLVPLALPAAVTSSSPVVDGQRVTRLLMEKDSLSNDKNTQPTAPTLWTASTPSWTMAPSKWLMIMIMISSLEMLITFIQINQHLPSDHWQAARRLPTSTWLWRGK